MSYSTPMYDYDTGVNNLTTQKGLSDIAQTYGRFLSQERFRRGNEDRGRQFHESFPRVGRSMNRRGIYDSGIRREAQQKLAEDFQRQGDRARWDFGAETQGQDIQGALGDAAFQQALFDLASQYQKSRATGFDPFAGLGF